MIDLTSDLQVLSATIYGEARGDIPADEQAVACVVMNRVAIARVTGRRQFGDGSVHSACTHAWQFSCWTEHDPNRSKLLELNFETPGPDLGRCIAIAQRALSGQLTDQTHGATFYKVSTWPWPEDWGAEVLPSAVIGRQSFYRLP